MWKSKYLQRIVGILIVVVIIAIIGGYLFKPKDFGNHGSLFYKFYRLSAIDDEARRPIKFLTNSSCKKCHNVEYSMQVSSVHKTVSCEFCHGSGSSHVDFNGKIIGHLERKKGKELVKQCLRCHNGKVLARKRNKFIKTIIMPDHLKEQKVKLTHSCDQCHVVHAPLKNIKQLNKFFARED